MSQASRIHETICTSESSFLTWHSYCIPVVATGMYGRAHASGHSKFSRQRVRIQLPFADPWSIRLRRCSNVAADSEGEHHVLAVAPSLSVMARHRHRAMAGVPAARRSCRWPQRCHGKVLVRVGVLPGSSDSDMSRVGTVR